MNVLGTPIERARDDERGRTLLVSDLHVPLDGGGVLADLRRLLDDARTAPERTRVVVLGDLFEYLAAPGQLEVGAHRELVEMLGETTASGVSVTVLHGNRDFMLDGAFARRTGARVVAGGLLLRLGALRCLALHGDELCLNDLPYQRAKKLLRHPLTRWLLRRMPLRAALWLGARARAKSEVSVQKGDPARFLPTREAVAAALAGADLLVFGHIHRPTRGRLEGAGEYCVLPAFDETGVYLEHDAGALRYRTLEGRSLPDFPATAFA